MLPHGDAISKVETRAMRAPPSLYEHNSYLINVSTVSPAHMLKLEEMVRHILIHFGNNLADEWRMARVQNVHEIVVRQCSLLFNRFLSFRFTLAVPVCDISVGLATCLRCRYGILADRVQFELLRRLVGSRVRIEFDAVVVDVRVQALA